jgi:hypothetical protein
VDALVGPQARDGDDAVGDLADRAEILAGDVGGLGTILAVAGLVDDQHAALVRRDLRVRPGQFQAAGINGLGVPHRLREEGLQALDGRLLRLDDGLGPRQRGQGLVAIPRQEESREVVAEAAPLGGMGEEVIEARGVLFQRAGR